jgi:tRNA(fMet)-specific endonuclease VapC
MFVLDTNTLVYFFRGEGAVAQRLLATRPNELAIPAVVVHELETGISKSTDASKRRSQLDTLLCCISVLPFGLDEARISAIVRARLEQLGTPIGPLDTLIAGTALAHRGTLVTRNVREFARVEGLAVVNWYDHTSANEEL